VYYWLGEANMTRYEIITAWEAVFAIGKGIAYLLAMSCMIKYLIGQA
jgi:hypothetical protein